MPTANWTHRVPEVVRPAGIDADAVAMSSLPGEASEAVTRRACTLRRSVGRWGADGSGRRQFGSIAAVSRPVARRSRPSILEWPDESLCGRRPHQLAVGEPMATA